MATDSAHEEHADLDSVGSADLDADLDVDADDAGSVRGGVTVMPPSGGASTTITPGSSGRGGSNTSVGSDVHSKANIVPVAWPDVEATANTRPSDKR